MADIKVECVTAADGWLCQVAVSSNWSETRHAVTLTRADFQRLAAKGATPEQLVRRSIEFLLARESKEAILPAFDLPTIGRYFPDFEREIRGGSTGSSGRGR